MNFSVGQVVLGPAIYSNEEGAKIRPQIIVRVFPTSGCYLLVECNSLKPKHLHQKGIIIREDHEHFTKLGFLEDTFINCSCTGKITEIILLKFKNNPIGNCPFMADVLKKLGI